MENYRQKSDNIQKGINNYMNEILKKRGVDDNEFHTNSILGAVEESNNKILSVSENVTTSNGNEDVLIHYE